MNVVTIDGLPVYRAEINGDDTGMLCISLVDEPAVLRDFQKLSKQERDDRERVRQLYTIADAERQIVRGVVMRADFPIYRRDANGFEYYIIYKADTIREMAEKYLADNFQNRVNLDHEEGAYVDGVQLVQWFIKDTAAGIVPDGFDDCADGSLFAEFHVTDAEIWDAIKAGTYRGFSLEGVFDLAPEQDQHDVERIVEETRGLFSRLTQIFPNMKFSKFFNALRKSVEMRSATSDKGVIAWDGDDDVKVGDELFVEDEDGNRTSAADDTYTLTDGRVLTVEGGKVASIAESQTFGEVSTDKGAIRWDGDEDLKAGDAVYRIDEDGNRAEVEDGEYTTTDGKVITVADGKVASITDTAAEVEARRQERMARIQKYEASYDEKIRAIYNAIFEKRGSRDDDYFYIAEAGDDYAVICYWGEDYTDHYYRYAIRVDEDANVTVENDGEEVKMAFVPIDFVSPWEDTRDTEIEALRKQVAELKKQPAALPAHKAVKAAAQTTGDVHKDNLARILTARR